jgi:hypothetical protein
LKSKIQSWGISMRPLPSREKCRDNRISGQYRKFFSSDAEFIYCLGNLSQMKKTILVICIASICALNTSAQTLQWVKQFGSAGNEQGHTIAVDAAGDTYTAGAFEDTLDFDPGPGVFKLVAAGSVDAFVTKLDASGNLVWAKKIGSGTLQESGSSIALDSFGNIYISGTFRGTADFDPGSGTFNLTSAGANDIFVSKLDAMGNLVWARRMGGTSEDFPLGHGSGSCRQCLSDGRFPGNMRL